MQLYELMKETTKPSEWRFCCPAYFKKAPLENRESTIEDHAHRKVKRGDNR